MEQLKKITWQERSTAILKVQKETGQSIRNLAEEFGSSIGKIHNDLKLGEGLVKYPEIAKIESCVKALRFLKRKGFQREAN